MDAYERRADWQAALIVALVVVPGFAVALAEATAPVRPATTATVVPRRGAVRASPVRPPRSC